MSSQLLVSLSHSGIHCQLTLAEMTNDRKVLFRISYPLTYTEACNLGEWATARNFRRLGATFLTATGWDMWLPYDKVMNSGIPFHPLHSSSRRNTNPFVQERIITEGHYSISYP
jgi:hypothetical protein